MVYFPPQQNNKNGINLRLLEGVKDGGESTPDWTTPQEEEEKKKNAMEFNQSTWLSLHVLYTECTNCHLPSLRHGNSPISKPVCICVLKFQTKLLSMLKMTLKLQKQNTWLDVNFDKVLFISPTLYLRMPKAIGLNTNAVYFNDRGFTVIAGPPGWVVEYNSHYPYFGI